MVLLDMEMGGHKFQIHEWLKVKLDNIKKAQENQWDAVFLIDGIEGCGKSTLGITCSWYLTNGKFKLYNICSGSKEAIEKLDKIPDGGTMLIDEGSLLFSSTDAMRTEQRNLIKILNVIRQKRMCLIIVSPSFFRLNRYISVDRGRFLIHVYTTKDLKRGRFLYFSQKKKRILYEKGKKNFDSYNKPKSNWNGKFIDFNPFGKEYQEVKRRSLMEALSPKKKELTHQQLEWRIKNGIVFRITENLPIMNKTELGKAINMSRETISHIISGKTPKIPLNP